MPMYGIGTTELLVIVVLLGCPALVVMYIVATVLRGARSQKDTPERLDRIEHKLDEKAEK